MNTLETQQRNRKLKNFYRDELNVVFITKNTAINFFLNAVDELKQNREAEGKKIQIKIRL